MSTAGSIWDSVVKIVDKNGAFVGTGFFITKEFCITCHHVIYRLNQINVQSKNSTYPAEWDERYSNMEKDIAVLRVKDSDVAPLAFVKEAVPDVDVIMYGFPAENLMSFPEGMIVNSRLSEISFTLALPEQESQGDKPWNEKPKCNVGVYSLRGQFDVGFGGAPVLYRTSDLKVLGMFTAKDENYGYVIPIEVILERLSDIKELSVASTKKQQQSADVGRESEKATIQENVTESREDLLPTMISTDRYTFDDKLGYKIYAYALARFLTDGRTKAPVCISIQAPWGGGKTSLMRMVRAMIDKNAPGISTDKNIEKESQNVRLKEIKQELKKTSKEYPEPKKPEPARSDVKPRITIWFNAWTYESTEQVWAGLADSIVKGIADRLGRVEREWFYLRLNLRRRDPDSIRKWISDRTFSYIWQKIVPWVWVSVSGIGASTMTAIINWTGFGSDPNISNASLAGAVLSGGLGFFKGINKKVQTENEPAEMSLGQFIKVPDYNEKVGFIHNVVRDLTLVFETIPEEYKDKPIIIFIDDLDRCSPTKIAQVVEGINLFLAGEFPGCIFIMGIDAEMVAAALEAAHKDVISNLPSYSDHMPIGWRFMDKFVQLPIIIPPSLEAKVKEYVNSLLPQIQVAKDKDNRSKGISIAEGLSESLNFTVEESQILDEMGKKIDAITDADEKFLNQVRDAASRFSNNPREIKRFINLLRFERFLMTEILKDEKNPEFNQVSRWIVLSLKWPQLVRWLYWSQNNHDVKNGLEKLEECAKTANNPDDWKNKMKSLLQVNPNGKSMPWLEDETLMDFFKTEVTKYAKAPLSAGAGKGLY